MQQPATQSTFAYFDSGHEFPEEIAMAAGFTPYKVLECYPFMEPWGWLTMPAPVM